ncbi:hemerythrin domain-containing protein [Paraflavitalea sp. CAU 1676]|uniref:hemerythrin domain-containing protein n=1 Tax=Paraflavitalea sp. CAU 1676 TaxID=3032598 RepID=UPI0023DCCA25|nr:hemerythrin domain-containing protein [Paraflavitalea sp. CAU 1676]MDF2187763.1 hemerythrin domain-containing protein [Paraflavitalea sp. CAU 1676]
MERNTVLQPFLSHLAHERDTCTRLLGLFMSGKNRDAVKLDVLNFWQQDLRRHVDAEEAALIPFLQRHHFNQQLTALIHREHDTIRILADRLLKDKESDYLFEVFIKLVHQHLLFEDKVVFHHIEETIPAPELAQLRLVA